MGSTSLGATRSRAVRSAGRSTTPTKLLNVGDAAKLVGFKARRGRRFVPATWRGPFAAQDTKVIFAGAFVVVERVLAFEYDIITMDGEWRRRVGIEELEELSPLEQLAAVAGK